MQSLWLSHFFCSCAAGILQVLNGDDVLNAIQAAKDKFGPLNTAVNCAGLFNASRA